MKSGDRRPPIPRPGFSIVCHHNDGMRNQEIAVQLALSEHTVRNYLIRIFDKLGISSRVELVLYAFSGSEGTGSPENAKTFSTSA